MERFDDVVIGAGQAGLPLAVRLAKSGRRVALIERRVLGGTCVNDGCIPSKTYVASARAAHHARQGMHWGVQVSGMVTMDMGRVKDRKDELVQSNRKGLAEWINAEKTLTHLEGSARFTGKNTVAVGERTLQAERFFLNTGARAVLPDVPGLAEVALTNTTLLELAEVPQHLLIVGGGVVAVEFAQTFRRFGAQVTVLQRAARLLPREDPDVSDTLRTVFEREGITLRFGVDVQQVERRDGQVHVRLKNGATVVGSHLLAAAGRRPNSDDLGLEHAGVQLDAHGYVQVNDVLQTSAPHVWALGDVNGRGAFTHTSYNDYEILEANLFGPAPRSLAERIYIACTYTDPALGRVGMTETEAKASGKRVLKGVRPMTRVHRARAKGETDGFIKVLVDQDSQLLLGATVLGVDADEAMHAIAGVMNARAPFTALKHAVFAHPTVSELIPSTLGELEPL